jgi:hypothetical protein
LAKYCISDPEGLTPQVFCPKGRTQQIKTPQVEEEDLQVIPLEDAPWCWYDYLQNWVIFGANVAKYSSTMEHLGLEDGKKNVKKPSTWSHVVVNSPMKHDEKPWLSVWEFFETGEGITIR